MQAYGKIHMIDTPENVQRIAGDDLPDAVRKFYELTHRHVTTTADELGLTPLAVVLVLAQVAGQVSVLETDRNGGMAPSSIEYSLLMNFRQGVFNQRDTLGEAKGTA